ncbi:MAG: 2-dehydro-3-deoxygalactonokinase [Rheinheimera sp.]|nr:2-dehydro-3-deoxygalactonokinase [Rheinheimera sp.]
MVELVSVIEPHFIAIDWGASQLKAFLCEPGATMPKGTGTRQWSRRGGRPRAISSHVIKCGWQLAGAGIQRSGVLMAGHITSSLGWYQTAISEHPCLPQALLPELVHRPLAQTWTYGYPPGLRCALPEGGFDVMRGEEVQLLGLLQLAPSLPNKAAS